MNRRQNKDFVAMGSECVQTITRLMVCSHVLPRLFIDASIASYAHTGLYDTF